MRNGEGRMGCNNGDSRSSSLRWFGNGALRPTRPSARLGDSEKISFGFVAFLGVDAIDAFFAEDALAGGLDFGFIVGARIGENLAELGVMIERFARGVEFE